MDFQIYNKAKCLDIRSNIYGRDLQELKYIQLLSIITYTIVILTSIW